MISRQARLPRVIRLVVGVALVGALTASSAFAAPVASGSSVTGALADDSTLTAAEAKMWEDLTVAKERALESGAAVASGTIGALGIIEEGRFGLVTKSVPAFRQERTNWCGPASARQSLSWHRTFSRSAVALPSQATLAGRIGTVPEGSTSTGIARALNSYSGTFGRFTYVASDLTNQSNPRQAFILRIGSSLSASPGSVPIILAETQYIPRYRGHAARHYVSVSGYDERTAPVRMRSVDPHFDSRFFGIFWDPVGSTTVNGLFRACFRADQDGTNLAMVW
ncbi:MAG: C39 family peptidase [Actinobacteria bacterium]|nr:C39 family peptidase [Actinomycetota bacterium]MCL5887807.1 C39 family peptidase [Actinomycetota bacterium]